MLHHILHNILSLHKHHNNLFLNIIQTFLYDIYNFILYHYMLIINLLHFPNFTILFHLHYYLLNLLIVIIMHKYLNLN